MNTIEFRPEEVRVVRFDAEAIHHSTPKDPGAIFPMVEMTVWKRINVEDGSILDYYADAAIISGVEDHDRLDLIQPPREYHKSAGDAFEQARRAILTGARDMMRAAEDDEDVIDLARWRNIVKTTLCDELADMLEDSAAVSYELAEGPELAMMLRLLDECFPEVDMRASVLFRFRKAKDPWVRGVTRDGSPAEMPGKAVKVSAELGRVYKSALGYQPSFVVTVCAHAWKRRDDRDGFRRRALIHSLLASCGLDGDKALIYVPDGVFFGATLRECGVVATGAEAMIGDIVRGAKACEEASVLKRLAEVAK